MADDQTRDTPAPPRETKPDCSVDCDDDGLPSGWVKRRKGGDFWGWSPESGGQGASLHDDLTGPGALRRTRGAHWSIVWSDLMMTMFILFAVMFIYKSANREFLGEEAVRADRLAPGISDVLQSEDKDKAETSQAAEEMSIASVYDSSLESIEARNLSDVAKVDLVADRAVRIVLPSDLLFEAGKAELKERAVDSLREVADIVRLTPYLINVVGHTDSAPIHSDRFPTNWELSALRACRVARFLIEQAGIPGNRIFVSGHSFYQPVAANSTESGRSANRRVEIVILKDRPIPHPDVSGRNFGYE